MYQTWIGLSLFVRKEYSAYLNSLTFPTLCHNLVQYPLTWTITTIIQHITSHMSFYRILIYYIWLSFVTLIQVSIKLFNFSSICTYLIHLLPYYPLYSSIYYYYNLFYLLYHYSTPYLIVLYISMYTTVILSILVHKSYIITPATTNFTSITTMNLYNLF